MANNIGKKFEKDFQSSVPDYVLVYRLKDSAQSFGKSSKLRFSSKNPFDFILWDSSKKILYALELKTVSGKSISFERNKDDHGDIHLHQIEGLNFWNKYDGTKCGFIVFFRATETTVFIDIDSFNKLSILLGKKSFNLNDLESNHLPYVVIPQKKVRTRYRYNISDFLSKN